MNKPVSANTAAETNRYQIAFLLNGLKLLRILVAIMPMIAEKLIRLIPR
jgi:hypothetical protein